MQEKRWMKLLLECDVQLIIIFFFLLHIAFLNNGLFHHDSVRLAMDVEQTVSEFKLHSTIGGGHGTVLVNAVFYFILRFFGMSAETVLLISTALFGAMASGMFYLFLKELFHKGVAFISMLIFSFTPLLLSLSTFPMNNVYSLFFVFLSGYLIIRSIKQNSISLLLLANFICFGLFFFRLPYFLFFFVNTYIFIFWRFGTSKADKKMIYYYFASSILFGVVFYFLFRRAVSYLAEANPLWFEFKFVLLTLMTYFDNLSLVGALVFLAGLVVISMKNRKVLYLFLVWFLPSFIYSVNSVTVAPRKTLFSIVPMTLIIGFYLYKVLRKKPLWLVSIVIIICISTAYFVYPALSFRSNYSSGKEMALFVGSIVEEDSLVILPGDFGIFLEYYAGIDDFYSCNDFYKDRKWEEFHSEISKNLENGRHVYMLGSCFFMVPDAQVRTAFLDAMAAKYQMRETAAFKFEDYHKAEMNLNIIYGNTLLKLEPVK